MGNLKYKGYSGSVEYDEEENYFTGRVLGLRKDCIIYEGNTIDELIHDFHEGIDHYLQICKEKGNQPEKPYSGRLLLRISPTLHGEIAEKAANDGLSLNEYITRTLRSSI